MATRLLTDLHKMSQHQPNAIRKEELIKSIMNAAEPTVDGHFAVQEQLKSLIEEVSELKKVLTSPNSIINKKIQDLQDQMNKKQIIAKQQRYLETLDRKERECM